MSRADLLATRDAAALAFERAEAQYRGTLPGALYRAGSVDAYNIRQDARLARREAQDAVDASDRKVAPWETTMRETLMDHQRAEFTIDPA